jgi:hypothetical protein
VTAKILDLNFGLESRTAHDRGINRQARGARLQVTHRTFRGRGQLGRCRLHVDVIVIAREDALQKEVRRHEIMPRDTRPGRAQYARDGFVCS